MLQAVALVGIQVLVDMALSLALVVVVMALVAAVAAAEISMDTLAVIGQAAVAAAVLGFLGKELMALVVVQLRRQITMVVEVVAALTVQPVVKERITTTASITNRLLLDTSHREAVEGTTGAAKVAVAVMATQHLLAGGAALFASFGPELHANFRTH